MDESVNDENKLLWFKWFCSDVSTYLEAGLTYEQIGMLFVAVMQFVENGIKEEVEPAIKLPYLEKIKEISIVREKYNKKCETNAKNGAKGGIQKGINAMKAGEASPVYKLPSKTAFRELAKSCYTKNEQILKRYSGATFTKSYNNTFADEIYNKIKDKTEPPYNNIEINSSAILEILCVAEFNDILSSDVVAYIDTFPKGNAFSFLKALAEYKKIRSKNIWSYTTLKEYLEDQKNSER